MADCEATKSGAVCGLEEGHKGQHVSVAGTVRWDRDPASETPQKARNEQSYKDTRYIAFQLPNGDYHKGRPIWGYDENGNIKKVYIPEDENYNAEFQAKQALVRTYRMPDPYRDDVGTGKPDYSPYHDRNRLSPALDLRPKV